MRVDHSFSAHIDGFSLFYHITPIYVVAPVTTYMLHFPVSDGFLFLEWTGR
jgi:hypothetical protein